MGQKFAAAFFPKKLARIEKRRANSLDVALTSEQIASLFSMRFNRKPLYQSIEDFYAPEYAEALRAGAAPAELAKIKRYRGPTQKEVNLLFNDIHAKEEIYECSGSNDE
ncbi:MAG: hypothetical protein LBU70_06665 [Chitinispirillales bacterium]|jgi:hypothetical protein|nr:hypothetical protein [Chitinispirillales bacterium]